MKQISFADITAKIINLRQQDIILDNDVASLYGVETKHINQAVKNNPLKFPDGYLIELSKDEWSSVAAVKSKILTSLSRGGGKVKTPTGFTEKGLYMLATILKSSQAIETTIAIIEAYSKLRMLSKNIKELSSVDNKLQKKHILQKSGDIITDLLDDNIHSSGSETTIELNFAVLKLKHVFKKNHV